MLILVANLGSTSFKFRLFRFAGAESTELAKGGVERLGTAQARSYTHSAKGSQEAIGLVPDHAAAIDACLCLLKEPEVGLLGPHERLGAIGFKAVHGGAVTGVQWVDDRVLAALDDYAEVAPAHNPIYAAAMRLLKEKLPGVPLVAAFETGFHQSIAPARSAYAVPETWRAAGVRRYGFHGASHRYIAERMAQILCRPDARIISCHLGGSSSVCAIRTGQSVATSMGFSPQSGLPQNNRVGDLDVFALPFVMRKTGMSLIELLQELNSRSGLLGLGGSNDLRDLQAQADEGATPARVALTAYVQAVRDYLGAYLVLLNGADALVFTGGIGENSAGIREAICEALDELGIRLDRERNAAAQGEAALHAASSRVQIWTVPTNEELIVARQTWELLQGEAQPAVP